MLIRGNNKRLIPHSRIFINDELYFVNRGENEAYYHAVVTNADSMSKLTSDEITKKFSKALDEAEIPHFRFHDLRHYSASIRHFLGIPDSFIQEQGGWSSDVVLKQVYRHAMSDKQKEMNNKANNYFSNLVN